MQSQSHARATAQASHTPLTPPARRRGRAPKQHDRLAGIAVSAYAPLTLPHPLELFGSSFLVHISTHLTFHPDTLARAVLDTSMDSAIRKLAPTQHGFMRKMATLAARKHKLSAGMRGLMDKELVAPFPQSLKARLLRGLDGEKVQSQPSSHWELLLQGLQGGGPGTLGAICDCLAACDAHGLYLRALAKSGEQERVDEHLRALLEPELRAWVHLHPRLEPHLFLPITVTLKTLAWLECRLELPARGRKAQPSGVDGLLAVGQTPMGNWLDEVCLHSHCANLGQLARRLEFRAKYGKGPLRHGLLRKWRSSSTVLMPRKALPAVLAGVPVAAERERLEARFYVARLFTFVCALLRAGTHGTPQPWDTVQAYVRSRHDDAYRRQVAASAA